MGKINSATNLRVHVLATYLFVHFVPGLRKNEHKGRVSGWSVVASLRQGLELCMISWESCQRSARTSCLLVGLERTTCCFSSVSLGFFTAVLLQLQLIQTARSRPYDGSLFYAGSTVADWVPNPLFYGYAYVIPLGRRKERGGV
jgi:hypothetical protein